MKFKKIPKEYFPTILDRLTRFEPASVRYKRVFDDIINKFSLSQKLKNLTVTDEITLVEEIFNSSLENTAYVPHINNILINLEEKYFKFNEESYQYLSARLNLSQMILETDIKNNAVKNLLWLKKINEKSNENLAELRESENLLYPVEKIILCEGRTEFVLLNTLFALFGEDLDKKGFLILAAGGKNQVARKYYKMIEYTKLPFCILLDKDAASVKSLLEARLRQNDTIYLINSGEFEDLIPKKILQKTINFVHRNEQNCMFEDFCDEKTMVENLHDIYKKYGFGEFKKAQFASELNNYIACNCDKNDFLDSEISEIIKSFR